MTGIAAVNMISGDNSVTVTGVGELDLGIGPEFEGTLADAVSSGRPVTVDLCAAEFIDSAILQSLAAHGKTLHKRGDRLRVLVQEGGYPDYVLKMVGFDCLMDIEACEIE